MKRVRILITPRQGLLDPQGEAIAHALKGLGFKGVREARQGKIIDLVLDEGVSNQDVEAMCTQLLINSIMEDKIIVEDA